MNCTRWLVKYIWYTLFWRLDLH